jgi:hypothetical protein
VSASDNKGGLTVNFECYGANVKISCQTRTREPWEFVKLNRHVKLSRHRVRKQ